MRLGWLVFVYLLAQACTSAKGHRAHGQQPFFSPQPGAVPPWDGIDTEALVRLSELRVAIIGAGASGSSAAYFLSRAGKQLGKRKGDDSVNPTKRIYVDVFERSERVGGRTMAIHPLNDTELDPVEVGASIFADANYNLQHAADEFGLSYVSSKDLLSDTLGVWDGKQFVIETDGSTWSQAKLFWRYGRSPSIAISLVKKAIQSFVRLYSPEFLHRPNDDIGKRPHTASGYPWPSVSQWMESLGLRALAGTSAKNHYTFNRVSSLFVDEIIDAVTRTNYAQDVDQMHAFAGLVSLAASGARGVDGGNQLIFERMLNASGATVKRRSSGDVTGIMKLRNALYAQQLGRLPSDALCKRKEAGVAELPLWWVGTRNGHGNLYDAVLVATPWHNAGITLLNTNRVIPRYDFRRLHVTIVVTSAKHPNPIYFGHKLSYKIPRTILTTYVRERKEGENPTSFLSLSYVDMLRRNGRPVREKGHPLHVVKLFSLQKLNDENIEDLFGKHRVLWTYRKTWDSYPILDVTDKFGEFEVDTNLYNINAMERWVSTMETSTVAAKNVVAMLLERWLGPNFVHGTDCHWNQTSPASNWAGWGCDSS